LSTYDIKAYCPLLGPFGLSPISRPTPLGNITRPGSPLAPWGLNLSPCRKLTVTSLSPPCWVAWDCCWANSLRLRFSSLSCPNCASPYPAAPSAPPSPPPVPVVPPPPPVLLAAEAVVGACAAWLSSNCRLYIIVF
jgi:hypothetical protein